MKGLIVDFGGVLTTSILESFVGFCNENGIPPERLWAALRADRDGIGGAEASHPVHLIETGRMSGEEFNRYLAGALNGDGESLLADAGLKDRLFFAVQPEPSMVMAVSTYRAAGIKTALLSNSWGGDGYPRETFDTLFDTVVLSGEVGYRKPQPEIYHMTVARLGLAPQDCVFVDDLNSNIAGAEAIGMTGILHTNPEATLEALEKIFQA